MFVITVIPLRRGVTVDTLSYFSSTSYPEGTLVTVPIRSSTTVGIVTESKEVSTAKTALRAATFSLKKLPPQEGKRALGEALMKTAHEVGKLYAASTGAVLYNILPPEVQTGDIEVPHTHHVTPQTIHTPQVLQARKNERYLAYRSLVRETFAHSGSVLLVVPSSVEVDELRKELEHGIEDRIIVCATSSTKSELKKAFGALEDFSKAKLIITTPSYAVIERHDITHVIIESARSSYYKELSRPYLDYRDVIRIHAKHTGRKVLFADILPRSEEEVLRRNETYQTYAETPKRIELTGTLHPINMAESQPEKSAFTLFSKDVLDILGAVKKKKERVFIFAARRGLAPLVACVDCGHIFRSSESGCPYSLIRTMQNGVEERWFVCSTSGERIRAADTCTICGSWRLRERGIGVQQVYDELHKLFPQTPIILFDHITAKTFKKATFQRDAFYGTKGAILLGTHMALPYLKEVVDHSVIVSMDALLATPTWRLEEENLALLLKLREMTKNTVFVQTRSKESNVLEYARHGSVENFYTDELELRKQFHYPPFITFIHLTWQGTKEVVEKIESEMNERFSEYNISIYQNPTSTRHAPIMYGLIRVPKNEWPNEKLYALLRSLPPSVRIIINPDRIV
jgi:primosomal protein N' (replication factor Y)